ncbi:MAG: DUF2326 domain-containing protein [Candidatus Riflebacteria bacterium]|nr:DUF2326 domain-containing protein [Candidatus Riflebacteria bacterium]
MILHGITASEPGFQSVRFGRGLNVILADRSSSADAKDTRNALGKTTLLEILDFCLGASSVRGRGLLVPALHDWTFSLDATIAGAAVRVSRSVDDPGHVILEGDWASWVNPPQWDPDLGRGFVSVREWCSFLGRDAFGLSAADRQATFHPTFRSLFSYFLRLGPDAYLSPFQHFAKQSALHVQLNTSFLLGLSWEMAREWHLLKEQQVDLRAAERAIESGVIEGGGATLGELQAERLRLEQQLESEQTELQRFRVHPQYRRIQEEADGLTAQLHELANVSIADRGRLRLYEESLAGEQPPDDQSLESLYREAGVVFPSQLQRTLDEARDFHRNLVVNRRLFLENELQALRSRMASSDGRIKTLSSERGVLLEVLQTHGAIDELTRLQEAHTRTQHRLETVKGRIGQVRSLKVKRAELKSARAQLFKSTELEYEERKVIWERSVRVFNENSFALYNTPGNLVIDITEAGYRFDVEIQGSHSEGIGKMKVLCYDLMLAETLQQHAPWPGFIAHDSIVFDGVDSRQRARALELAAKKADQQGWQYICTLNSDMVPTSDFSAGFSLQPFVVLRLTDRDPSGSLLGMRY